MRVQIPFPSNWPSGNQLENFNHTILDRRDERTHHVYPYVECFYIFVLYFFWGGTCSILCKPRSLSSGNLLVHSFFPSKKTSNFLSFSSVSCPGKRHLGMLQIEWGGIASIPRFLFLGTQNFRAFRPFP